MRIHSKIMIAGAAIGAALLPAAASAVNGFSTRTSTYDVAFATSDFTDAQAQYSVLYGLDPNSTIFNTITVQNALSIPVFTAGGGATYTPTGQAGDVYQGTIQSTPSGGTFGFSYLTGSMSSGSSFLTYGQSGGMPTLTFLGGGGATPGGFPFNIDVYLPGDFSAASSHTLISPGNGFTLTSDFVFDAVTNRTRVSSATNAFVGGASNLNFVLFGAVPEPGTWAMMLCGFGVLGGALRCRRAIAVALQTA